MIKSFGLLRKRDMLLTKNEQILFDKNKTRIMSFYDKLLEIMTINIPENKICRDDLIKLNYYDTFYLMIVKSFYDYSYQGIIDLIYNDYSVNITKHALQQREQNITLDVLELNFYNLVKFFDNNFNKENINIISVDGTESKGNINLIKHNFKSVPTESHCMIYISTLYDSRNDIPRAFYVSKNNDERDNFKHSIDNVKSNDIVIFDRGYPCIKFMKYLNEHSLRYIIRAPRSYSIVKHMNDKCITDYLCTSRSEFYKGFNFRIVKYIRITIPENKKMIPAKPKK